MKTLLTLLATAVMVNLAIAQGTQAIAKTGPELLVLKETSFDFRQEVNSKMVTRIRIAFFIIDII